METIKITVYDYKDTNNTTDLATKYEVDAWCVGGEDGIKAYFYLDDMFCEAHGDDGHWWLVSRSSAGWVEKIKEAINSVNLIET